MPRLCLPDTMCDDDCFEFFCFDLMAAEFSTVMQTQTFMRFRLGSCTIGKQHNNGMKKQLPYWLHLVQSKADRKPASS